MDIKHTDTPTTAPALHAGVYYWPTFEAARAYCASVGVTLGDRQTWPHAVSYTRGWAIQLDRSGAYLGPQHVKLETR